MAEYEASITSVALRDVIEHYNAFVSLGLTDGEKRDLIEYLKSL